MRRILIDTHAWLWSLEEDPRLSRTARKILTDDALNLMFSAASIWEISIKAANRKLTLPNPPDRFIPEQLAVNNIEVLPVEMRHALRVFDLPMHHQDPFDRLLVAQSLVDNLELLTADEALAAYGVQVIW